MSEGELRNTYSANATGQPVNYAIRSGSTIVLGPSPQESYDLVLNYYQKIPVLSDSNTTNWLLTAHPDLYLYGALVQAEAFMIDDNRVPLWQAKLTTAMLQVEHAGQRKATGGAPIRIRSPYNV